MQKNLKLGVSNGPECTGMLLIFIILSISSTESTAKHNRDSFTEINRAIFTVCE